MMRRIPVEPAPERSWTLDDRLALLSVLQELTVAVLALFDPARSIDSFLEKVAARLGSCVALCLEAAADGRAELLGSAGLARTSRGRAAPRIASACGDELVPVYPELAAPGLVRWSFPLRHGPGAPHARSLLLWFSREPPHPIQYRGLVRRLAEHLAAALDHRALFARALRSERALQRLNDHLEHRVATRTQELVDSNHELAASLRRLEEAQAQLVHAGRMAAVGQLAAGVAHEINNPLACVLANVSHALGKLPRDPANAAIVEALEDVREGAERARAVVQDLKTFARTEDAQSDERADVGEAVRSSVAMAQNEIRHRARLVVEVDEVPPVAASPHRIGQVLLNLLVNAAHAIPEGRPSENEIRLSVRPGDDGRVVVEVKDTGTGIAPEILPRIFEPFFTTKPVGIGSGLGLSICHGIVQSLGGEIRAESRPGAGSSFQVLLPPAPAVPGLEPRAPAREAEPDGGRVLVVDDDTLVGRAVVRTLSPAHDVRWVDSGAAALAALEEDPRFDVVLCDVMMPGMSGVDLYERAIRIAPSLERRFVFVTGGAFTEQAREFLERAERRCLEKPFGAEALRSLVREIIRAA